MVQWLCFLQVILLIIKLKIFVCLSRFTTATYCELYSDIFKCIICTEIYKKNCLQYTYIWVWGCWILGQCCCLSTVPIIKLLGRIRCEWLWSLCKSDTSRTPVTFPHEFRVWPATRTSISRIRLGGRKEGGEARWRINEPRAPANDLAMLLLRNIFHRWLGIQHSQKPFQ